MTFVSQILTVSRQIDALQSKVFEQQRVTFEAMLPFLDSLELFDGDVDDQALSDATEDYFAAKGPQAVELAKLQIAVEREKTQLELKLEPLYEELFAADEATWHDFSKRRFVDSLKSVNAMLGYMKPEAEPS